MSSEASEVGACVSEIIRRDLAEPRLPKQELRIPTRKSLMRLQSDRVSRSEGAVSPMAKKKEKDLMDQTNRPGLSESCP